MSCIETLLGHPRSYYDLKMLSNSFRDNTPFSSQFDDVEKAIENLVKSGKLFFWKSSLQSTARSYPEYDYRSSYPLIDRQSGTYELEHMRSHSATNPLSYASQHYYNQRAIGHTEQFSLPRRKNKSNSECNIYTALERSAYEQLLFPRERVKTPLIKNGISTINDDIILSKSSEAPKILPNYIYEELDLKNSSISTLFLPSESSSYQYPFTYFQEYSTNMDATFESRAVNNVIGACDSVKKSLPFLYRKKNNIMENNEALSLVSTNKVKNILAPIGTKSSGVSLSVDPLNQQVQDTSTIIKPLQHCFSSDKDLKNDMYNGVLLKKYMESGKSIPFSWNNRIWSDVKNLGITPNSNGFGLDVLC